MTNHQESLSIYRRWRPQRFADVVNQEGIVRTLRNAVTSGSVAHAYLFAGERGIGKTSIARILARAANCLEPANGEPCNRCARCTTILNGRSLDIVEIDGASNRGIDHIRRLREEVSFAPTDLSRKVYIIDEVHMLTNEAFNALLKTLEEPPAHAMFIFATTEPYKVPRTIISRCQAFEFRRISPSLIASHLMQVGASEGTTVAEDAARLIAERARGGMRDALVMLEQAMSYQGKEISAASVLDMLGLVDRSVQEGFIEAIRTGDRPTVLATVDGLVDRGKDLETFLTDVVHILRDRLAEGSDTPAIDIDLARRLLAIKADLYRSLDRRIRIDVGLLELLSSLPTPVPSSASAVASRSSPASESAPDDSIPSAAPMPPPNEPEPADEPEPPLPDGVKGKWQALLREIEQDRIAIAAFLLEGRPRLDASRLTISFHPEHTFHKDSIEKRENLQYLAGVVRRHFGDDVRVDVELDEDVIRKPLPHEVLHEKARLVCKVFDGKIVKEEL